VKNAKELPTGSRAMHTSSCASSN